MEGDTLGGSEGAAMLGDPEAWGENAREQANEDASEDTDGDAALTPLCVLDVWSASSAITEERHFQTLVAAQHCSYPGLLPAALRDLPAADLRQEMETMRSWLYRS